MLQGPLLSPLGLQASSVVAAAEPARHRGGESRSHRTPPPPRTTRCALRKLFSHATPPNTPETTAPLAAHPVWFHPRPQPHQPPPGTSVPRGLRRPAEPSSPPKHRGGIVTGDTQPPKHPVTPSRGPPATSPARRRKPRRKARSPPRHSKREEDQGEPRAFPGPPTTEPTEGGQKCPLTAARRRGISASVGDCFGFMKPPEREPQASWPQARSFLRTTRLPAWMPMRILSHSMGAA